MAEDKTIIIRNLAELTSPQVKLVLDRAVIKATGTFKLPPLDLDAIQARADELDPKSQTKADIYMLLIEIRRLNAAQAVQQQG